MECTGSRREWIGALDKIESLNPRAVVASHKRPENGDNPGIIEQVRQYIRDFLDRLAATTTSAQDLYKKMLELYPNRVNPGWALWSSAPCGQAVESGSRCLGKERNGSGDRYTRQDESPARVQIAVRSERPRKYLLQFNLENWICGGTQPTLSAALAPRSLTLGCGTFTPRAWARRTQQFPQLFRRAFGPLKAMKLVRGTIFDPGSSVRRRNASHTNRAVCYCKQDGYGPQLAALTNRGSGPRLATTAFGAQSPTMVSLTQTWPLAQRLCSAPGPTALN